MKKYKFGRLSLVAILSASFIVGCGGRDAAELSDFDPEDPNPLTTDRVFEAESFTNTGTQTTETLTTRRFESDIAQPHLGGNSVGEGFVVETKADEEPLLL